MTDLHWIEASEAAQLIASKKLSPIELTEALISRIEKYDVHFNTFITFRPEQALEEAKKAEEKVMQGQTLGCLHGVPYGLKDIINAESWPTTAHSKLLIDNIATEDAHVTARLRHSGAILLGKLSTHEFALGGPSFDLPWPPARNAWNRNYFPGGSSSGSGAAVAAGFIPLALGSDTGGSVRNPASMNGLIGMKPTYGRVSRSGVIPLSFSLDHIGPLTRTVRDNALTLSVISGYDELDPASARTEQENFSDNINAGIQGLKIGVIRHFYTNDMIASDEMTNAIEEAINILGSLGAEVLEVSTRSLGEFAACNRVILLSEACSIHRDWLIRCSEHYGQSLLNRLLPGTAFTAVDYVEATRTRARYASEFNKLFLEFDAIVTVNNMEPAPPIEDFEACEKHYPRQARTPFNVTGNPALAVPIGFSENGLPLSMQIVADQFNEEMVYRVAAAYERDTDWAKSHPDLDKSSKA
ncbi:MAG: Asp-tRNA(Asn)/Glu-tRNA(Gln) amidotransferase GatCAB subunit A [Rhodospirillaceae bacterium]|nr:Asp-tRNA(Asn)/Glu-tRNA(Gln) amidotransferase GatCAB subunit A [Rhodospirillaceae bacterium]|tara:strand:+ start:582 stop:1991 length:1410 start_codon:yes stop_codon:yes gene_type:complete